jgi:CPA1 family monovalent cation:H+ antiporter
MNAYQLIALILFLVMAVTYINHRFIRLPDSIALMASSLLISLILLAFKALGLNHFELQVEQMVQSINFETLLMNGFLSFLLFAGSLTVKLKGLLQNRLEIILLALFGTLISTFLTALGCHYLLLLFGFSLPFLFALLFGALISPTDPIAVLAMCKNMKAPEKLSTLIAGESLFNDGVGIVIFLTLYAFAIDHQPIRLGGVALLFLRQAGGGLLYGTALGLLTGWLMKPVQDYRIHILLTLTLVSGGYVLAQNLGISGPLAMVAAGICIGNAPRLFGLGKIIHGRLLEFWELLDEILNGVLFLLMGFELLVLNISLAQVIIGPLIIGLIILVRFITVAPPLTILKKYRSYPPHTIKILTWGGLRGGLAVALALSLPPGEPRSLILVMTYAVVVFSILIQSLTIKPLVRSTTMNL